MSFSDRDYHIEQLRHQYEEARPSMLQKTEQDLERLKAEEAEEETEQKPNGFTLTKLCDLLSEPEELVDWLIDGLLPAGGFSVLAGKPKAGKSTLARNLALAVAQGGSLLGRLTQRGPVVYLALEEKRSEVRKHFQAMGATGEEEIYIYASTAPADAIKQIRAVAEERKPVLVIIDPLFRLARVKDSNDYAQVTQALEPLLSLARETGAHVLCVHHASKGERQDGDSILGSTAIFAAVDSALIMKRSDRYRTIKSIQRYGEDLEESTLRFDAQTRTVTLGESKEREEVIRMRDAMVACLQEQEGDQTEAEIDEEVEGKTTYKRKALRELVGEERVERRGQGSRGDPFRYALKDSRFLVPTIDKGTREQGNKKLTPEGEWEEFGDL